MSHRKQRGHHRHDQAANDCADSYYRRRPGNTCDTIKATLQLHFAANDDRVNSTWPPYEAALKAAGVPYEAHTYPGTQHGFNNDTTPRYDAAAAALAWQRTIDLFKRTLST